MIALRAEESEVRSTTMPIRLAATPTYMTCTARRTDCGSVAGAGDGTLSGGHTRELLVHRRPLNY